MNRKRVIYALYALLAVGVVGGGTVSVAQADEPPNHANRLEATFTESNVSVTNRIADLGVFQLINTGTGTVEGLGGATLMLSATQDRSVHPCALGAGRTRPSGESCLRDGVLVVELRTSARPIRPAARAGGRYGASSTDLPAPGNGDVTIVIPTSTNAFGG